MCLYNHPLKQEREHFAVAEQKGFLRLRPKAIEGRKKRETKHSLFKLFGAPYLNKALLRTARFCLKQQQSRKKIYCPSRHYKDLFLKRKVHYEMGRNLF